MTAAKLRAEVVAVPAAGEVWRCDVVLDAGATLADALRAARVVERFGAAQVDAWALAVGGRAAAPSQPLVDGDRLELLRALQVDPKEARRLRYRRDGLRPKRRVRPRRGLDPVASPVPG